jgi:protein YIPF6
LIICLFLAILLSGGANSTTHTVKGKLVTEDQSAAVFASVFVIVWCGAAVVTLNAVLLGGTVSFFQSICVLGYCLFPLTIAAVLSMVVGWTSCGSELCLATRLGLVLGGLAWSTRASLGFLSEVVSAKRGILAAYPVCLFYGSLAWIIVVCTSPK